MARKVIIIGSGPAGWSAAIYAARAQLEPLVLEGDNESAINYQQGTLPLGQLANTTEVENFPGWPAGKLTEYLSSALKPEDQPYWVQKKKEQPGHVIYGPELMRLMRQQAVNFGTEIQSKDVVEVDFSKRPFVLKTHDGQTYEAATVIVATGARANWLGLPSEDKYKNNGVSACAVCDGALPVFKNKPLVVVGAGDTAVEEASYLTKFASKVYRVVRRNEMRASKIMANRALANPKIEMKWNRVVEEVLGDDKFINAVRLKSTVDDTREELPVGGMFVAIGHTPNTKFLNGALKLTELGYVQWTTLARTYTSVEGVFAAGDVSDDYYRQAVTAAGTGCMAALDAERFLSHHGEI